MDDVIIPASGGVPGDDEDLVSALLGDVTVLYVDGAVQGVAANDVFAIELP